MGGRATASSHRWIAGASSPWAGSTACSHWPLLPERCQRHRVQPSSAFLAWLLILRLCPSLSFSYLSDMAPSPSSASLHSWLRVLLSWYCFFIYFIWVSSPNLPNLENPKFPICNLASNPIFPFLLSSLWSPYGFHPSLWVDGSVTAMAEATILNQWRFDLYFFYFAHYLFVFLICVCNFICSFSVFSLGRCLFFWFSIALPLQFHLNSFTTSFCSFSWFPSSSRHHQVLHFATLKYAGRWAAFKV